MLVIGTVALMAILWTYNNMNAFPDGSADFIQSIQTSPAAESTGGEIPTTLDGMENSGWLEQTHRGLYHTIKNTPWVKDGLTEDEAKDAQNLLHMGANDHETLKLVLTRQWAADGITPPESKAIGELMYLSYRDNRVSRKVAGMRFLDAVTEADALLVLGLNGRAQRGTLSGFMTHPTVVDGITDEEVLFAVAATTIDNEAQVSRVLSPGNATVETIQTSSPRTPHLSISIVRAGARRATDSSLVVEEAVEYVENAMGMPLPTNHVILLLDDTGVTPNFAGTNYGQAIAYLRSGEDGGNWERANFMKGMVHEVAHYFWHGNEDWIDEGIADTIEANYARDQGFPQAMLTSKEERCSIGSLEELDALEPQNQSAHFICNYHLGSELFLEIQASLGEEAFRSRLRELYRISLALHEDQERAGIDEVRNIFPQAEGVIAKHWDGSISRPEIAGTKPLPETIAPLILAITPSLPTEKDTTALIPPVGIKGVTATPLKTEPPTPTPVPTPTPEPEFSTYQDDPREEFEITYPFGWAVSREMDTTKFLSPDGRNRIVVQRRDLPPEWGLGDIADEHQKETLQQARKIEYYREISAKGEFQGGLNFIEIKFKRKTTLDSCTEDGVTRLRLSHFLDRPAWYVITMTVCEEDLETLGDRRTTVLDRFREK